jgi:hypothetical protein
MIGMKVARDVTAQPRSESWISNAPITEEYFLTPELTVPARMRKIAGK